MRQVEKEQVRQVEEEIQLAIKFSYLIVITKKNL